MIDRWLPAAASAHASALDAVLGSVHVHMLVIFASWLALFVIAYRTEGLVEIAENVRAENPERILSIARSSLSITLFVLAAISAVLAATDAVRLFRR